MRNRQIRRLAPSPRILNRAFPLAKNAPAQKFQPTLVSPHTSLILSVCIVCRCLAIFARQRQDDALGAYAGEWPKAASTGGGAAGPAIDRVKSTTSHYSSTTPPRAPSSSAYRRPARFPPALPLLPPPRCRCRRCYSPIPLSTLVLVVLSYSRTG